MRSFRRQKQPGFTLIELIIVIVIIGILAAVAIPRFTTISDEATRAKNTAILGMVKSAWTVAFSLAKVNPTITQVVAQTLDPQCTGTSSPITCGTLSISFVGTTVAAPSEITCTTSTDCS